MADIKQHHQRASINLNWRQSVAPVCLLLLPAAQRARLGLNGDVAAIFSGIIDICVRGLRADLLPTVPLSLSIS